MESMIFYRTSPFFMGIFLFSYSLENQFQDRAGPWGAANQILKNQSLPEACPGSAGWALDSEAPSTSLTLAMLHAMNQLALRTGAAGPEASRSPSSS